MDIVYLISSDLDYSKLICNDAGPLYASLMGWTTELITDDFSFRQELIYIIDNRISKRECSLLQQAIVENKDVEFLPKIVDPYFYNTTHYYYHFLGTVLQRVNVRLFSVYEPKELTEFFSSIFLGKVVYVPYPYDPAREIPLEKLSSRKSQVIISGALDGSLYPYRAAVFQKSRRSITRLLFPVLKHPGYAEFGNGKFEHPIVGNQYIRHLSGYKWMLLCGTRASLELLKFHECAYAGCLPVGESPNVYPSTIKNLFLKADANKLFSSFLSLRQKWNPEYHFRILEKYRTYLRKERDVITLNSSLKQQLGFESAICSS